MVLPMLLRQVNPMLIRTDTKQVMFPQVPKTATIIKQMFEACKNCDLKAAEMFPSLIRLSSEAVNYRRLGAGDARVTYVPGPQPLFYRSPIGTRLQAQESGRFGGCTQTLQSEGSHSSKG